MKELNKEKSEWNKAYKDADPEWGAVWGKKPDRTLVEYSSLAPRGKALVLGMGEGRNALYLAQQGFEIEGYDISEIAVRRCLSRASNANLVLKARVKDIRDLNFDSGSYSMVVSSWVLHLFSQKDAERIAQNIIRGLNENGLLFFGAFTPEDPAYERVKSRAEQVDPCTFYWPERNSYTRYFTKESVLSLFKDLKTLYCMTGILLDRGHGSPHYHNIIEYVGQKVD